jgi:hypothetical protein
MNKLSYKELRQNPPKLSAKENARELIITTVSCMCDNVHYMKLKKNEDGDFKLNTVDFALSNWQMKHPKHEIEWEADAGNWDTVFKMINSGVELIAEVKSR